MGRAVLPEDGAHLVANVPGEGVARQPEHLRKGLQEGDAQLLLPMKELRRANIEPTHESSAAAWQSSGDLQTRTSLRTSSNCGRSSSTGGYLPLLVALVASAATK